jgi:O-glycosyl hydrolase
MKSTTFLLFVSFTIWLTEGLSLASAQTPLVLQINIKKKAQTINNFGASGCWFSEPIGRYWADSTKEKMAELLFSKAFDKNGNPKGIGLSAWRFNIGGGSAEQGDSSGIRSENKRVECFLNKDGSYDWNKQSGYLWFTKKARGYGVEKLIAFVNSPPVYYTKNGLGYKTVIDQYTNLKSADYSLYAAFLAEVLAHFDRQKLHFDMISPVNEPQWDWFHNYGEGQQEGSSYTNREIYGVVKKLDSALTAKKLNTRILMPEAAMLSYLYNWKPQTEIGGQIGQFWSSESPFYLANLPHIDKIAAGHSYFTDDGVDNIINTRKKLADTADKYGVSYWQTEYSMLGPGYREGLKGRRTNFDCALFLAKLIHHDLTDGNASAWQFWNAWEPGRADFNTRYYLLALKPAAGFKSGTFSTTKNLWALGHYSRFIRPGMARLILPTVNDEDLLASAWYAQKKLVLVLINNGTSPKTVQLDIMHARFKAQYKLYITTAKDSDNMSLLPLGKFNEAINLQPRAIYTLVAEEK